MLKTLRLSEGKLCEAGTECPQFYLYVTPDEQEKQYLITQLGVDEHTLSSALDPDEVGRIEFEANHVAAIIKRPKRYTAGDNFMFKIHSLGLFLFPDKLIVVSAENSLSWDGKAFSRLQTGQDIFLRVIFSCIVHFEEHLRVIRKISDELELEINKALSNKDLLHMFKLEKSLVYYLDAINSNNKVMEKLKTNSVKLGFTQETNEFLEDAMIEGNQCLQQAKSYSEVLSSMMDAWASTINNNLSVRLKTLTILSICIMTPTLVVSVFSMNVPLPAGLGGTHVSFWFVVTLAASSGLAVLVWGRLRKW